jgi:mediator of RNA polymerase II transcription subunit 6
MSNEFFRDGQWLDAHGGLVEPHTAEEYFSGSQWYDRTCLNEQWKIQGVQPTDEVRSRSAGIEYRMVHLQPPVLYVLRKERREGGQDARALGSYYILDGTIFQAPTVEHVITSRMVRVPCCRGAARERGARARHGQHDDDDDPPQPWL